MSTPFEQTVSCVFQEIDKFLASPFSERVVVPLLLDHWVANHIISKLYDRYAPRIRQDASLTLESTRGIVESLHIDSKVFVYEVEEALTRPILLRGDSALMYVIDEQFEDFRSKYLDRTMANTLATARHAGFAGIIHTHGEKDDSK